MSKHAQKRERRKEEKTKGRTGDLQNTFLSEGGEGQGQGCPSLP